MSTTIDNRVVEMEFDNAQFEKGMATTTESLNKFNDTLNLTGATQGLENVDAAAKKLNFNPLSAAVETVGSKFSALEVIAFTALQNITNDAINKGKQIASALTIDPIMSGFDEYETKINSIQTIMTNTAKAGTSMEDVTKVINELNTYADKTIYNFAEMTRNVGTFTAAGVSLEDSASAIQGIANLAAASGSTSQQASTAMYQLSQALAKGKVQLQDWISVENAMMGGQLFQGALVETAEEFGLSMDHIKDGTVNFRESLQDGWLSADILNTTLNKFTTDGAKNYAEAMIASGEYTQEQADAIMEQATMMEDAATKVKTFTQLWSTLTENAQSGWSQSWEIIIGDFEEAKEVLTSVNDTIGALIEESANARNEMLQDWKDLGGRTDLIEAIKNTFEGLMSVVTPIKEAFEEIFPPLTGQQLADFTENLKELTATFVISDETAEKLKNTFKGVFAVFDILGMALGAIWDGIKPLLESMGLLGDSALTITSNIGLWIVNVRDLIEQNEIFSHIVSTVVDVVTKVIDKIREFIDIIAEHINMDSLKAIHDTMSNLYQAFVDTVTVSTNMEQTLIGAFKAIRKTADDTGLTLVFEALWKLMDAVLNAAIDFGTTFVNVLTNIINGADVNTAFEVIETTLLITALKKINDITGMIKESFTGFTDLFNDISSITGIFDGLKGVLVAYQNDLKAGTLMTIATAISLLVAAIVALTLVDPSKMSSALEAITLLFVELVAATAAFRALTSATETKMFQSGSTTLVLMATAILILANALKGLAEIEPERMVTSVAGLSAAMYLFTNMLTTLSKQKSAIKTGGVTLILMATSIKILASVVDDLSELDIPEMIKGLTGLYIVTQTLSAFAKSMDKIEIKVSTMIGFIALGGALKIIASVVKDLGDLNFDQIVVGLGSLGVILIQLALFSKMASGADLSKMSIGLIALSTSLLILSSVIKDFSQYTEKELLLGLGTLAAVLVALVGVVKAMPKNVNSVGTGLILVSTAITIMSGALKILSTMSLSSIINALIALGGALGIMAIALNSMKGTLGGAAALVVATTALAALTPVMAVLGAMSLENIFTSLIAMAGAFFTIGFAAKALAPTIPAMFGLAGALTLLSISVAITGAGLVAIGAGLVGITAGIAALAGAGIGGLILAVDAIKIILTGLFTLIPTLFTEIANGITAFIDTLGANAVIIGEALGEILDSAVKFAIEGLLKNAAIFTEGILSFLITMLEMLIPNMPKIIDLLITLFIQIIDGIAARIPELLSSVLELFASIFGGLIDAIGGLNFDTLVNALLGIGSIAGLLAVLSALSGMIPSAMIGLAGLGLLVAELGVIIAALGLLNQIPGFTWLIEEGGELLTAIGGAIGGFVGGIIGGVAAGLVAQLPGIGEDLSTFMTNVTPFVEGAKKIDSSMMTGVTALAEMVLILTAASLLDGLASWFGGGNSIVEFGKELEEFGPSIKKFANSVDGITAEDVTAAANAAKTLAEMSNILPNKGGMVEWFTGENSMSDFAEELVAFGPKLVEFSKSVEDIDTADISAAANSAKILAEMSNIIPNQGGMVSWFTGDNTLSMFAEDLAKFGPAIKEYSDSVSGVDSEDVASSVAAAQSLAAFSDTIPNAGGLWALITGDNTLSGFGEDLAKFGPNFAAYSLSMSAVDPDIVSASTAAALSLAEFATKIPDTGGLFALFGGDNNIADFGADLKSFGADFAIYSGSMASVDSGVVSATTSAAESLVKLANSISNTSWGDVTLGVFGYEISSFGSHYATFYAHISTITPSKVTTVIDATWGIVDLAKGMNDVNPEGMAAFGEALGELGDLGIKGFTDAFDNSQSKITTAVGKIFSTAITEINAKKHQITTAFDTLLDNALAALDKDIASTSKIGETLTSGMVNGINAGKQRVIDTARSVASGATSVVEAYKNNWYNSGYYFVVGLSNGISNNAYRAVNAARNLARSASTAMNQYLVIKSPSRLTGQTGEYFALGFVNMIESFQSKAASAAVGVAKAAADGLTTASSNIEKLINADMDASPVITPVLDLSQVDSGMNLLFSSMSNLSTPQISTSFGLASATAKTVQGKTVSEMNNITDSNNLLNTIDGKLSEMSDGVTINNEFNINSDNPEGVANEVSTVLQKQLERKNRVWA